MRTLLLPLAALALMGQAPTPVDKVLAPGEIVAAAPKGDWVAIPAWDLLVMDLTGDRRVVIQLMPPPFSQSWVGNIRKLAAARWWDGTSINRVQDNYVVQWGDANAEDKVKAKELPPGLLKVPEGEYLVTTPSAFKDILSAESASRAAELNKVMGSAAGGRFPGDDVLGARLLVMDAYGGGPKAWQGWPLSTMRGLSWPVHCYGMVGVGRDMPPDTGTGAELYTVIGHAPRHLDRNIALVGRVISGIEHLSSLPRGTGALGFYDKAEERVTIVSVRIGNEVAGLPRYEYLSTESVSFARYADARANRRDAFFIQPAGGADICNIPVPVRVAK